MSLDRNEDTWVGSAGVPARNTVSCKWLIDRSLNATPRI